VHSGNYFNYSAGRKTALQSPATLTADDKKLLPHRLSTDSSLASFERGIMEKDAAST